MTQGENTALRADKISLLPPQERTFKKVVEHLKHGNNVVLQAPTGGGKTRMAAKLLDWAANYSDGGIFYVNRKALVSQTRWAFQDLGLDHGVRAADHDDGYDSAWPIQIASADTERSRVYGESPVWAPHDCSLVIVDEAHIQKGDSMMSILKDHMSRGSLVVMMSATPVGLGRVLPDSELVTAGTLKEFRDCGLLVPAVCKSIEQPDLRKVQKNATGEYMIGATSKKIYTQTIVGNVIKKWRDYNPDGRPTMLYAPGKPESVWFCKQFNDAGIPWCHVDATEAYWDDKRYRLSRSLWEDILGKYSDGTFKGISCRFKLREGIDVPHTYHVILATPIGSIQSYLQTVGRSLRAAPEKDHALITDHGGNYLRHGSPNHDRPWDLLWRLTERMASGLHETQIAEGEAPEPIRCPNCEGERWSGLSCPHCGFIHPKSVRHVIMEDGRFKTYEGHLIRRKRIAQYKDTQRKWDHMYYGFKNKGVERTFTQLRAFFAKEHGYWPPKTLYNQPLNRGQWEAAVFSVHPSQLRRKER